MATPGEDEIHTSSTAETLCAVHMSCSPCDRDGKRLEAVGYCVNCKEYLCETCFKCHRIPTLMRKHVMLDKTQMDSNEGFYRRQRNCQIHPEKLIEYHCSTHSLLGCHVCFFRHQESCKNSKYIQDVAETFASSAEFKEFQGSIDTIASKANEIIREAKIKPKSIENLFGVNVESIKAHKSQILETLDKLEKELINTAYKLKNAALMNMTTIAERCVAIQETTRIMSREIEVLQNKSENLELYIHVVNSKDRLGLIDEELNGIDCARPSKLLTFEGNTRILKTLRNPWGLGHFVELDSDNSVDHIIDINVDIDGDTCKSSIRGSVMMNNDKMVLGDFDNRKVKLLDTKQQKVIADVTLSNSPRGVAKVTDTSVAVTVPDDKKIVFINTEPSLNVVRELQVNGICYDVSYYGGNLAVIFKDKQSVEVMDLQGKVLRVLKLDDMGKELFSSPFAVVVNPVHNTMYISDHNSVISLTFDGNVIDIYTDTTLQTAAFATLDNAGMMFVCAFGTQNVHLMTGNCRKVWELFTEADGLTEPRTIDYDEREKKVYIGNGNILKVYRVSYATVQI